MINKILNPYNCRTFSFASKVKLKNIFLDKVRLNIQKLQFTVYKAFVDFLHSSWLLNKNWRFSSYVANFVQSLTKFKAGFPTNCDISIQKHSVFFYDEKFRIYSDYNFKFCLYLNVCVSISVQSLFYSVKNGSFEIQVIVICIKQEKMRGTQMTLDKTPCNWINWSSYSLIAHRAERELHNGGFHVSYNSSNEPFIVFSFVVSCFTA